MKMISGIYWDCGERAVNQDSLMFQQVMTTRGRVTLAAVSDGIGGLEEGEQASGYITEKLIENFYRQMISLIGRKKGKKAIERSLMRCFYEINDGLRRYGNGREIKLGATISLIFVWKRKYVIFHIGDSRIYLCGRKEVRLLTRDDSDGGRGLTRCMGSFPFQQPQVCFGKVHKKYGFLLCTDGFYRTVEQELGEILAPEEIGSEEQIEKRLKELGMAALKRGEKDNMSAVYLAVSKGGAA
ncbi:MAG: serine/threonine-protein phosphatase [Lachnospiraceae bacterium]|nr:serine/threonine-protein phosphatase [Lachnospiraceae bacterium]